MTLRFAIPSKGRLADRTEDTLAAAGIRFESTGARRLVTTDESGEIKALYTRTKDIPEFVAHGSADAGVTGWDLVREAGVDVEELVDLGFGSCRLVVAVPEGKDGLEDGMRVATSFPRIAREWFDEQGWDVEIVEVSGAAEAAPHLGVADTIVDLTSTGTTLASNRLEPIATVLESSARLIANPDALSGPKAETIEEIRFGVESVIRARQRKYLMADIPEDLLDDVTEILPGIEGPTVVPIEREGWVAIQVVVDADRVDGKIRALKKLGAKGILVMPIERLVP